MKRFFLLIVIFSLSTSLFSQTWDTYNTEMVNYFQKGDYKNALISGEKAAAILKVDPASVVDYVAVLNNLAYIYYQLYDYDKAINSYHEVIAVIEPVLTKEHVIYARVANNLGEAYLSALKLEEAGNYIKESYLIRTRLIDIKNPEYTQSLRNMKKLHFALKQYEKAEGFQDSIKNNMKELFGEESFEYLTTLNEEALFYMEITQYKKSAEVLEFLVKKMQDSEENESADYFTYLRNLGIAYKGYSNYKQSIETFELLKKQSNAKVLEKDYALYINELGVVYFDAGLYHEALKNYQEALQIRKKLTGEINSDYAYTLNNMAVLYYNVGNFVKAEELYLKSKEIREKTIGKNHPEYASSLNSLAVLYEAEGNYEKAEPLYKEALKLLENSNHTNDDIYFTVLTNISKLYDNMHDYVNAEKYYIPAFKKGKEIMGENSLDFSKLLNRLGVFFGGTENHKLADSLLNLAKDIQERTVGKFHPEYVTTLNNLGTYYLSRDDHKKSEDYLLKSLDLNETLYGNKHFQYTISLLNLAALYIDKEDIKKAKKYITLSDQNTTDYAVKTVRYMSEKESEAFLKKNNYMFSIFLSFYLKNIPSHPELAGYAYNNILFRKGLMLQSEKALRRTIINSNDDELIKKYNEFTQLKEKIGKMQTSSQESDLDVIDNLHSDIESIEKELVARSSDFKNVSYFNETGWTDIKKKLRKEDAAIEFVSFTNYDNRYTDSIYYCAILLRKELKYPKMIYLFEKRDLDKFLDKSLYDNDHMFIGHLYHKIDRKEYGYKPKNDQISDQLDQLIWKPIEKYLEGIKNVYISPDGLLHRISFTALSADDNTWLSEKYTINMLNNTRQILSDVKERKKGKISALLYGGIDYDTEFDKLRSISGSIKKNESYQENIFEANQLVTEVTRGEAFYFLDGTLVEAHSIEAQLEKDGVDVISFEGENAVEETIKRYVGLDKSPEIIHIATHGFFFPDPELFESGNLGFGNNINAFKTAQNPLFRSGLLFSGANHIWQSKELPEGIEDGILTAYEVSNLNLDNTELVILSACETGLGDIEGNEGVYGLQRAFKIAGTDYLIMSLWQVPDQQTVDLMSAFYKYKLAGDNIPEAFRKAQNDLKEKYLPFYWAAFVLIR